MTHKLFVELLTGETWRDPALHDGRTPASGEKICVHTPAKTIICRVQSVLPGALPHSAMAFEAVDDVHAKEE